MQPISGAHEIAITVPFAAVLAGRIIGPWLAVRRAPTGVTPAGVTPMGRAPTARAAVACVLVAAGIGYLCNLGYNAAQRPRPSVNQALAGWLVAHHLTSGIGGYWDADVTALGSGGRVTIAPVVDGAGYGYPWESKASWFDPKLRSAHFVIAHLQQLGAGYLSVTTATNRYGRPAREYFLGQTVVMVYRRNLLDRVIRPSPADLYRPPPGSAGRP
jgi:hypothetical protein